MSIRASRPVFKPEDYGIATYVNELVTPYCQVALVGDTRELNAAHEYIEVCARQQGMNVRAFADEAVALRWLRESGQPNQRYKFTRIVLQGAPEAAGVYALWDGDELVYYGRSESIRAALLSRLERTHATAELLGEHQRLHGRPPRDNNSRAS